MRWDDARSPLSPGLYLVLTSDVALLYRLCDVFLVWFSGVRVPNPGLSRNTWGCVSVSGFLILGPLGPACRQCLSLLMPCGIELGSVLRICRELLVVAALVPPNLLRRRRDVCPAREALLNRFLFDDLFTASGLGVLPLLLTRF